MLLFVIVTSCQIMFVATILRAKSFVFWIMIVYDAGYFHLIERCDQDMLMVGWYIGMER